MKAFINGKIIKEKEILKDYVLVFDETIQKIIPNEEFIYRKNIELIDVKGAYISPGFIDIHIHGSGGSDTMDATMKDLQIISQTLATTGVTSFLPTTMTMNWHSISQALETIRKGKNSKMPGAQILGAHMEGPFISEKYKGAQNPNYILSPNFSLIHDYLDTIKILTLAPEKDKDFSFIKRMKDQKIILSMGHTNSNYEQAKKAINHGISHVTHLFNAMSPMHHRKPGAVGAALESNTTCEFIADTIHVHPALFQLVLNIKGLKKVILITDSMRAGCLQKGIYDLGGQKVIVNEHSARLEDGTLAGSILTMNAALKNILTYTSLSVCEAVRLVSLNPAEKLNIQDKKGSIEINKDADLCIFDENYHILYTVIQGEIIHRNV
ncbi:N-acetylglucosamine-6-phosphate deacetylase [Garciella nitratireducens]|uniref:N-acetylglucosamine-6-phosphate deacetylase n=1 Tax=Garciella nitratireducens DSM 15102 TaxID=1121911 RepID=A0A1T4M522_9FIRM|nr:N-acetylglucosamine-6-phosphate deacetylase [Garciella nitratireducens]RBP44028.1 N-acetylglucosamine 6-phosphate deacetylase [Garciella nitratireducens]SJZ62022.1 N-acetylglucosamine-6-phosphate deacetylase [Garciella nitratireducens DSM 15102]